MKNIFLFLLLVGAALAQDGDVVGDIPDVTAAAPDGGADAGETEEVEGVNTVGSAWGQNKDTFGGIQGTLAFDGEVGDVCTVTFPDPVDLFHVFTGFFIPDSGLQDSSTFFFTTPPWQQDEVSDFGYLINFMNDSDGNALSFNASDIVMSCGPGESNLGVYSFPASSPNNNLNTGSLHASTILMKRDGYHRQDIVTVTFPQPVVNVTVDTRIAATRTIPEDLSGEVTTLTILRFTDAYATGAGANDENKQIHLHFNYLNNDSWFSASQVMFEVETPNK